MNSQENMVQRFASMFFNKSLSETKKHYKLKISGRVQSVWYRPYSKRKANEFGIKGFIQHTLEGLYAEIEGTDEGLSSFLEWCKEGPPLARVDSIDVEEGEIKGFRKFVIG